MKLATWRSIFQIKKLATFLYFFLISLSKHLNINAVIKFPLSMKIWSAIIYLRSSTFFVHWQVKQVLINSAGSLWTADHYLTVFEGELSNWHWWASGRAIYRGSYSFHTVRLMKVTDSFDTDFNRFRFSRMCFENFDEILRDGKHSAWQCWRKQNKGRFSASTETFYFTKLHFRRSFSFVTTQALMWSLTTFNNRDRHSRVKWINSFH